MVSLASSQYVLQYALPSLLMQEQAGCAHFFIVSSAILVCLGQGVARDRPIEESAFRLKSPYESPSNLSELRVVDGSDSHRSGHRRHGGRRTRDRRSCHWASLDWPGTSRKTHHRRAYCRQAHRQGVGSGDTRVMREEAGPPPYFRPRRYFRATTTRDG